MGAIIFFFMEPACVFPRGVIPYVLLTMGTFFHIFFMLMSEFSCCVYL